MASQLEHSSNTNQVGKGLWIPTAVRVSVLNVKDIQVLHPGSPSAGYAIAGAGDRAAGKSPPTRPVLASDHRQGRQVQGPAHRPPFPRCRPLSRDQGGQAHQGDQVRLEFRQVRRQGGAHSHGSPLGSWFSVAWYSSSSRAISIQPGCRWVEVGPCAIPLSKFRLVDQLAFAATGPAIRPAPDRFAWGASAKANT